MSSDSPAPPEPHRSLFPKSFNRSRQLCLSTAFDWEGAGRSADLVD